MTTRSLACAAILCAAGGAFASPAQRVALDVVECDRADEIRRIVALELGEPLADSELQDDAQMRGTVRCADASVTIRIDPRERAPGSPRTSERVLELTSTPIDVRPRVIALAAVELLASRAAAAVPRSSVTAVSAVVVTARLTMPARPRTRVGALASIETFRGNADRLLGGGIRVVRDVRLLDVFVDARVHHGADPVSLGEVEVTTVDGAIGVSRARTWRELELAVAAGARGGKVWFAGSPQMGVNGATFSAPWWGVFVDASVERAVSTTLRASLGIEVGAVVLPAGALVGGVREVAIDGVWIAARGGLVAAW